MLTTRDHGKLTIQDRGKLTTAARFASASPSDAQQT